MPERARAIGIGERFGRFTVESEPYRIKKASQTVAVYRCRCDCGEVREVMRANLLKSQSNSCGCLKAERSGQLTRTHGLSGMPLHAVWASIIARCCNPDHVRYKDYGGRGITICDEWRHDFKAFYDWAMSHGFKEGLTTERIDNDRGYSPDNIEFIPRADQTKNKRNSVRITAFGETKILRDWARDPRCCVAPVHLGRRIAAGMMPEEAMTTPSRNKAPRISEPIEAFGESKLASEWARDRRCSVVYANILWRIGHGYTPEEAISLPPYAKPGIDPRCGP